MTWHDHSIDIYGSLTHILDWGTFHKRFLVRITSKRAFSNQKIVSSQIKCRVTRNVVSSVHLFSGFWRFHLEFSDFVSFQLIKFCALFEKKISLQIFLPSKSIFCDLVMLSCLLQILYKLFSTCTVYTIDLYAPYRRLYDTSWHLRGVFGGVTW